MDSAQTLLLNQGFEPIKVISWQRAISLLFLGKVEVLEEYDRDVHSVSLIIKVPAVVRLLRAFRRHARPVKFSRVNIYARDNYKCQYCGRKASISDLTYDHVVPRSQGGLTEWTSRSYSSSTSTLPRNKRLIARCQEITLIGSKP